MRHFWDAAVALNPAAADLAEGLRFPICHPDRLTGLWHDGGLDDVTVCAIEVPTVLRAFDDYWTPFLGGQGPPPGYAMSLDESCRNQLRERIRARLPIEVDGSINLVAGAWAVRGVVTQWRSEGDVTCQEAPISRGPLLGRSALWRIFGWSTRPAYQCCTLATPSPARMR